MDPSLASTNSNPGVEFSGLASRDPGPGSWRPWGPYLVPRQAIPKLLVPKWFIFILENEGKFSLPNNRNYFPVLFQILAEHWKILCHILRKTNRTEVSFWFPRKYGRLWENRRNVLDLKDDLELKWKAGGLYVFVALLFGPKEMVRGLNKIQVLLWWRLFWPKILKEMIGQIFWWISKMTASLCFNLQSVYMSLIATKVHLVGRLSHFEFPSF